MILTIECGSWNSNVKLYLLQVTQKYRTERKTKSYVAFISLFSVVWNIPTFFESKWVFDEKTNTTIVRPTRLTFNKAYFHVYVVWMNFIIKFLVPLIIMVILSTLIIKRVNIFLFLNLYEMYILCITHVWKKYLDQLRSPPMIYTL